MVDLPERWDMGVHGSLQGFRAAMDSRYAQALAKTLQAQETRMMG